eukprot:GHRQ01023660.1.p1 GENE.GHRQ01023660.1~~GHRQ01023660.1.p1  ORF type:complete len:110 (-),score=12.47 GHRQ01023660.1:71-400(-)
MKEAVQHVGKRERRGTQQLQLNLVQMRWKSAYEAAAGCRTECLFTLTAIVCKNWHVWDRAVLTTPALPAVAGLPMTRSWLSWAFAPSSQETRTKQHRGQLQRQRSDLCQ